MKTVYGLKTTVIVNLAFLIVTAMLLLGIVFLKIVEKNLLEAHVRQFLLMTKVTRMVIGQSNALETKPLRGSSRQALENYLNYLSSNSEYEWLAVARDTGKIIYETGKNPGNVPDLKHLISQTLHTNRFNFKLDHSIFSPFVSKPPHIVIVSPITREFGDACALIGYGSMETEWGSMIRATGLISLYILTNAIILLAFGLYIFHHRVIAPINRMVASVANIQEGERLPVSEDTKGNELGKLSKAINIMLQRLEKNRRQLKETINSLEEANRNLRRVQKELIHSEKMASVGRLAAGVAHEIGNPIGILVGYMEVLKTSGSLEGEFANVLERMENELERVRGIIRRLLDFARPGKGEKVLVDLHQLLNETSELIKHQCLKSNISLNLKLSIDSPLIVCDPNQLKQVLLNVFFNAIDSMPSGGKLLVETYRPNEAKDSTPFQIIGVTIRDTGHGIPEEHLEKVFDPFFTTKEPGRGTGLGLAVSASILEGIGATISVESKEGRGTIISIEFPEGSVEKLNEMN